MGCINESSIPHERHIRDALGRSADGPQFRSDSSGDTRWYNHAPPSCCSSFHSPRHRGNRCDYGCGSTGPDGNEIAIRERLPSISPIISIIERFP